MNSISCLLHVSSPSALLRGVINHKLFLKNPQSQGQLPEGPFILPETNSSPLKIGKFPKGESSSNHPFLGAFAVSFREGKFPHCFFSIKHISPGLSGLDVANHPRGCCWTSGGLGERKGRGW